MDQPVEWLLVAELKVGVKETDLEADHNDEELECELEEGERRMKVQRRRCCSGADNLPPARPKTREGRRSSRGWATKG